MPTHTAAEAEFAAFLAESERRKKQTFAVGDLVRLAEDVGTKAQRATVWRVTALVPVKGQNRTDYSLEPVSGGRGLRAQAVHLDPADDATVLQMAALPAAERLYVGTVVVAKPEARLRGADPFTRLVVIAEGTDGTVRVAKLGGDGGRYWTKVRPMLLQKVEV